MVMRLWIAAAAVALIGCKKPADDRGACIVKMGAGMQCYHVTEEVCGIPVELGKTCQELGYTRSMGPESWAMPMFGACITRPSFGPAMCKSNVAIEDCPDGVFEGKTCEDVEDKWRPAPAKRTETIQLNLEPGVPQAKEVPVTGVAELSAEVTHTGGALGRISLAIHDARQMDVPVSADSVTCAEEGCSVRVVAAVGSGTETLIVSVQATAALSARLALRY